MGSCRYDDDGADSSQVIVFQNWHLFSHKKNTHTHTHINPYANPRSNKLRNFAENEQKTF